MIGTEFEKTGNVLQYYIFNLVRDTKAQNNFVTQGNEQLNNKSGTLLIA